MIKLSRTGITTLKKQYKSVLLKCLILNAGILFAATGAMAADYPNLTVENTVTVGNTSSDQQAVLSNGTGGLLTLGKDNNYASISGNNKGTLELGKSGENDHVSISGNGYGTMQLGKDKDYISLSGANKATLQLGQSGDADSVTISGNNKGKINIGNGNIVLDGNAKTITIDSNEVLTANSDLSGAKLTAGTVAKTALASGVQTSLGLADTAVQSVAAGSANGTIRVDGTDVAVKGLDTAAYAKTTDFDAAGTAAGLIAGLDATATQASSASNPLSLSITQTDGVITAISGSIAADTFDAYGAAAAVQGSTTETVESVDAKVAATNAVIGAGAAISDNGVLNGKTLSGTYTVQNALVDVDNALGKVADAKAAVAGASAATNMAAVVSQLSANLTNGTIDANFGNTTVDSLTIDGTSYGITSGGAATFASTTTDSLKVGSAAAITGETANTLNMHDNSLTNVKDIASAALTTNSSAKTVAIGGTGYTTTVTGDEVVTGKLGVTGDFAVNTNKFTVAASSGNTSIAGTLGVTGATTLSSTLDVTGKTTLSSTNGLGFGTETAIVKSIDDGSAAKTTTSANNATTMATVATVLKSAENAVYTGTATKDKTGATPATISAALDLVGDVKALTTSDNFTDAGNITVATLSDALQGIDATLGKIHGLYDNTTHTVNSTVVTSTVGGYSNLASGTTVEDHLVSLDNAIGNRFDGFKTNMGVDYADTALNNKQDLVTVISQVASNVGVAGDLTTAGTNGVAATNTVNQNIDTVNKNLGDVQAAIANSHYGQGAGDLSEMVGQVDNKLYALDRDVRKLKKEFKGGMASMAAMTALVPNARAHGNTQLAIGTGAYEGHTAAAIGGFHWINDNLLLNIGVSYGDTSKAAYRAGFTWSW